MNRDMIKAALYAAVYIEDYLKNDSTPRDAHDYAMRVVEKWALQNFDVQTQEEKENE